MNRHEHHELNTNVTNLSIRNIRVRSWISVAIIILTKKITFPNKLTRSRWGRPEGPAHVSIFRLSFLQFLSRVAILFTYKLGDEISL